jgi:HAD superfamily hydrolase (TIGR01548 family)
MQASPSQGNFVLARAVDPAGVVWLRDGLAGLGIAVRIFPGEEHLENAARITCPGDAEQFDRLCRALRAVLAPQALLFDMDGVLADVSRSYRTAIIETARHFGAAVDGDDVRRAKDAGDANNDWVLTRRLLADQGVTVSLDDVTTRFEELYQGTPEAPGLRRHETLLPPRALLERWAARRPLAVVTGRPRTDAERWLREAGVADLFAACVCMEDGPLKPDPAPVRSALQQLGVESAWLFGDTPDDVRAARAAGVVPVGVVAPGDSREHAEPVLLRAGAARVVAAEALDRIEEVMP